MPIVKDLEHYKDKFEKKILDYQTIAERAVKLALDVNIDNVKEHFQHHRNVVHYLRVIENLKNPSKSSIADDEDIL